MRSLIRRWASNYLYTAGPKIGEPSKIAPTAAISNDGIQPGSGTKIAAEEMNYALRVVSDMQAAGVCNALTIRQTSTSVPIGAYNYRGVVVRDPATGGQIGIVSDISGNANLVQYYGGETYATIDSRTAGAPDPGSGYALEAVPLVAGNAYAGIIWASTVSDQELTARYLCRAAGVEGTAISGSVALPHVNAQAKMLYDAEHDTIVGIAEYSGQAPATFKIADVQSTPVLSAATSGIAGVSANSNADIRSLAVGGGRSICMFRDNAAPNFLAYTSTDGGDTWAATSAPTAGTGDFPYVGGVFFEEDFLGQGPRFVCVVSYQTTQLRVYSSTDGSSWTQEHSESPGFNLATDEKGMHHLIGDVLFSFYENETFVRALDLLSGNEVRVELPAGTGRIFGSREVLGSAVTGGTLSLSSFLRPGLSTTFGSFSPES